MSPCGYEHGESSYLHVIWTSSVSMSLCLHVECLHVSMCIWTWSVSMSAVEMDMECLHISM